MLAIVAVLCLLFVVTGAAVTGVATFGSSCDLNSLQQVEIGSNTFIYAADNSRLGVIPAERNRQPVPFKRISAWMPKATVAIEDQRFYQHDGIDVEGIARALWKNVSAGQVVEGGSTITQQLVRNLYIGREKTVERKLKEACLAIKLDKAWAKNRILATYMNQVYYGNLAYGIEAAAQTYFSKHASELNLPEAAMLAGLPQAPSDYNPFQKQEVAKSRRNQVLQALLNEGDITQQQYDWAVKRGLGLKAGKLYKEIREPDFFGYVRDQLIDEYGAGTVRSGGLKVYTTIDPRFQRAAQKAIRETLYEHDDPAAGVISINPKNGAIRAMTAVIPGNKKNQFNLLSQARRQSGSTFKTFVLAAAVEQGINPETTTYLSAPFFYRPDPNGNCEDGSWWCPETYDHSYTGWTTIERATLRSDNTVYAQLTLDVTPEAVAEMATRLGVRSPLSVDGAFVPSIGLGAMDVSPLDMASAYATLAAGGIYSEPMAIRKVILPTGEDKSAGWGKPKRKRVISDGVAWTVTKILEENVQYGTGVGANYGAPAAGKTGTTEEHSDAWFCGYTPRLGTTVWVGYPRGKVPMTNVHGIAVAGGTFPAQIWRLFMSSAIGQLEPVDFPEPKDYPEWKDFERGQYARSFGYYQDDDYTPPRRRPRRRRPSRPTRSRTRRPPRSRQQTPASPPVAPPPATTAPPLRAAGDHRARTALTRPACSRQVRSPCSWRAASPARGSRVHRSCRRTAVAPTADRSARSSSLLLVLAFAAYLTALVLMRRSTPALRAVVVVAFVIQLIPLAGPLLVSTDAWTYWEYGRIAAVHDGDPYVDTPSEFPDDPAYDKAGADWRETTSVYGPAFTLVSEGVALVSGSSAAAAAWIFKVLAALGVLACTLLAARLARGKAYAAALVGWNPLFAIHFAGGGHNDSVLIALTLGALALAASGRKQLAGAAWALAVLIKWVPLVFFGLRAVAARAARRPVGHAGFAVVAAAIIGLATSSATASTGCGRSARSPATPPSSRATRCLIGSSSSACRMRSRSYSRSRRLRRVSSGSAAKRHAAGSGSGSPGACCSRPRPG